MIQVFHQVTTQNDGIIVGKIEFAEVFLVVIFQHEAIWLQDSEIINDLRILAQGVSQNLCNLIIEVLILVVYPLLNYAASNLCVVIVKGKEFTTVLGNSYMDVGQHGVFFI